MLSECWKLYNIYYTKYHVSIQINEIEKKYIYQRNNFMR